MAKLARIGFVRENVEEVGAALTRARGPETPVEQASGSDVLSRTLSACPSACFLPAATTLDGILILINVFRPQERENVLGDADRIHEGQQNHMLSSRVFQGRASSSTGI